MKTSELEIELLTVYMTGLYVKKNEPVVWEFCRKIVVNKLRRREKDE